MGTNPAVGLNHQSNIDPLIVIRGQFLWPQVSYDDQNSSYDSGRRQRNLNFHSHIFEVVLLGQVNLLPHLPNKKKHKCSPFLFLGIAAFHFNPSTIYRTKRFFFQALGTEGQGIDGYTAKYSTVQLAIPFGIGFKYALSKRFHFSMEIGMRKTFNDYLDDVSGDYAPLNVLWANNGLLCRDLSNKSYDTQGNQIELAGTPRGHASKDWYTFEGLSLSYSFQKHSYFRSLLTQP